MGGEQLQDCYPVQRYKKWFVKEMGVMDSPSVHEMKAEIYRRGPIVCEMDSYLIEFGKYVPGRILSWESVKSDYNFDHEVSVVGWGEETVNGTLIPYWIVRNSWGTWWGEDGFFRIHAGINATGIETQCTWAVPGEAIERDWGPHEMPGYTKFPSEPTSA